MNVSHPNGWGVVHGLPNSPFTVQHSSGSFVAMMPPRPTTITVLEPATRAGLEEAAVSGSGSIWDRTHLWLVSSVIEGQQMRLAFSVLHPDGTEQKDVDA